MAIRELASEVVALIAAGEVVTRPADAVKELIENAIDAILARPSSASPIGAVTIEIVDGGYTRVRVADDGIGIDGEELPMALQRHATSKIAMADDLQRLQSLGFRGEALAAIGAVADLSIVSSPRDAPAAKIDVRDGQAGSIIPAARQPGTTVTIERLFERVPARRKFQRPGSVETSFIARMVQGFALAYPEIAFVLLGDGRTMLRTPGTGDLRDTATAIFGPEIGTGLLVLHEDRELDDSTLASVGLSGAISQPAVHRASRNGIFFSVNRRPVDARSLWFAVEEAYATLTPVGRHPMAIIDISVPPDEVDANVHPTKREVHLQRDRLIFSALHRAVRATLAETVGLPTFGERPVSESGLGWEEDVGVPVLFGQERQWQDRKRGEALIRPSLGTLRVLGQVGLTYIICEGSAGLYLVDQHAAHERVVLERLEHQLETRDRVQMLLEPIPVAVPRSLAGLLEQYAEALRSLGFDADALGETDIVVRAVPAALPARGIDRALVETLETLDAEGAGPDWRERLAVLLSCKTAIKAGQHLESEEMRSLLAQLDEANLCATCSHGRPTAILLSHAQLEREFGRR